MAKQGLKTDEDKITVSGYLIIGENGHLAVAKRDPDLKGGQIAVMIDIVVPKGLFQFHHPKAIIEIDEKSVKHPPILIRAKHAMDKM